jgi:hypothetical protein
VPASVSAITQRQRNARHPRMDLAAVIEFWQAMHGSPA